MDHSFVNFFFLCETLMLMTTTLSIVQPEDYGSKGFTKDMAVVPVLGTLKIVTLKLNTGYFIEFLFALSE